MCVHSYPIQISTLSDTTQTETIYKFYKTKSFTFVCYLFKIFYKETYKYYITKNIITILKIIHIEAFFHYKLYTYIKNTENENSLCSQYPHVKSL